MSCQKTLTLNPVAADYPLDAAVYAPSVDKIFGTMGPYLLKCNASTGAVEASARVTAPAQGPCGIAYHPLTDMVYVSVWNSPADIWLTTNRPNRDIFPVNPATMAVGSGLGLYAMLGSSSGDIDQGPMFLSYYDHYLFFCWSFANAFDSSNSHIGRIDPANTADHWTDIQMSEGDESNVFVQFGIQYSPTPTLYYPYASGVRVYMFDLPDDVSNDFIPISAPDWGIIMPIAAEYCPADGLAYYISTNKWLMRADDFALNVYTKLDISSVGDPSPKPNHIRYRSSNQKLYLPSASSDKITIWNPLTSAVDSVKTGFDSPYDVVFTPTKAFAVQKGPVGLKEIV